MLVSKLHNISMAIDGLAVSAYRLPTDFPESDGTLAWGHTTLVVVKALAGGGAVLDSADLDRVCATSQPFTTRHGLGIQTPGCQTVP